jgi:hypothetical protein
LKKLMLLASMLAMVLLAASPALAQSSANAEQNAAAGDNSNINQQICQNVLGDINVVNQNFALIEDVNIAEGQYVKAKIHDESVNKIAQENNVNINVVQNCIQTAIQTGDIAIGDKEVIVHKDVAKEVDVPEEEVKEVVVHEDEADEVQYVAPEKEVVVHEDEADEVQYVAPEKEVVVEKVVEKGFKVEVVEAAAEAFAAAEAEGAVHAEAKAEAFAAAEAEGAGAPEAVAEAVAAEAVVVAEAEAPEAEEEAVTVLPDTGGASLFTLAAGALLVAGGLLARRIVR